MIKMKAAVIDRFEGELAIIEIGHEMIKVNRKNLPANAREGDIIKKQADGWIIDRSASIARKEEIDRLAENLWEDN